MAAFAMEKLVTCSICEDHLKQPKSLLCGHTFCCSCLDKWINKSTKPTFTCPECRNETEKPESGAAGLPDNYKVKDMTEEHEKKSKVTRMCRESGHDRDCEYYCTECRKAICVHCKTLSHEGHPAVMLSVQAAKQWGNLAKYLDATNKQIEGNQEDMNTLTDNLDTIEHNNKVVLASIRNHFQGLKKVLDKVEQKMLNEAAKASAHTKDMVKKQQEQLGLDNKNLQTAASALSDISAKADVDGLNDIYSDWKEAQGLYKFLSWTQHYIHNVYSSNTVK